MEYSYPLISTLATLKTPTSATIGADLGYHTSELRCMASAPMYGIISSFVCDIHTHTHKNKVEKRHKFEHAFQQIKYRLKVRN